MFDSSGGDPPTSSGHATGANDFTVHFGHVVRPWIFLGDPPKINTPTEAVQFNMENLKKIYQKCPELLTDKNR